MSTTQFVLTLVTSLLASNALAVAITLYFTRGKTRAEAGEIGARSHLTEAEVSANYLNQIHELINQLKSGLKQIEATQNALNDCTRDKAGVEIKLRESEAERNHVEKTLNFVRQQNTDYEKELIELRKQR